MPRFGRYGEEEEEPYGSEEEIGYSPYFEEPAPAPEPSPVDPAAETALAGLTGGEESLYSEPSSPDTALEALGGEEPMLTPDFGSVSPELTDWIGSGSYTPYEGPETDKFKPGDSVYTLPEMPGSRGFNALGRNDQYGLPEEYNILPPDGGESFIGAPGDNKLGGPEGTAPGGVRSRFPGVADNDPTAPRSTTPDDPTRSMNQDEIWQMLFGVPYGQFPPGYANPMGLPGVTGTVGGPGAKPASAAGPNGPGTGGATGANTLEGFNLSRAQNPTVSAKDAFAAVAQAAPRAPDASKEASEAWFNQNVKAGFEKYGHKVNWVKGDQMNFTSPEGTFTVDFHRGAGAPGSALWWGVQGGSNPGSAAGPGAAGMSGAAGAQGGMGGGAGMLGAAGGSGDANSAFQSLKSSVHPNAPKEQMEAAIRAHFANVPGFTEAYKESAKINGTWYDMVLSYGSPGAQWTNGLSPKG